MWAKKKKKRDWAEKGEDKFHSLSDDMKETREENFLSFTRKNVKQLVRN